MATLKIAETAVNVVVACVAVVVVVVLIAADGDDDDGGDGVAVAAAAVAAVELVVADGRPLQQRLPAAVALAADNGF